MNRRNIRKKPSEDVNASEDFFVAVTESHILAASMKFFNMSSLNDTPSQKYFPASSCELHPMQRRRLMLLATDEMVKKFVHMPFVDSQTQAEASSEKQSEKTEKMDGVYEYACEALSLGLLYLEFIDAIREGDGDRILRCWRYFLILFKASRRKNYAIEAFSLLAQEKFLLSPRQALQLKWSRTINTHGRPGKNIPCDLHMEHLNRECKSALSGLGSNITDKSVKRIGQCIGKTVDMLKAFDKDNGVPTQSGHHTRRSSESDIEKMVKQLAECSKVFHQEPGRFHHNFKKFNSNITSRVPLPELKQWMSERFKKLVDYN